MRYDIRLAIDYEYSHPVESGRHVLRVTPLAIAGRQAVESCRLAIAPHPDEWLDRRDFFGNDTVEITCRSAASRMRFEMEARVALRPAPLSLDISAAMADLGRELALVRDVGPLSPHHFTPASVRARPDDAIAAFAADISGGEGAGLTVRETVIRLGEALHGAVTYDPEATAVDTPASVAFALRRGVCQDFSHIMIVALRALGIPAGYVSGFLRTNPPPGGARLEGADAMHAWVRAWCGREAGYVEYDPTNATLAGADHVVIASGRDYADVAPVRGIMRSTGEQTTTQSVDVRPVDDVA